MNKNEENAIRQLIPLEEEDLKTFFSKFESLSLKKGALFIEQGKKCDYIGFVVKGCLMCVYNNDGKEVIDDGITGYIVPTNDPESISGKVRQLSENPALAAKMSENCKMKLQNDLSSQRTVGRYLDYFKSLL